MEQAAAAQLPANIGYSWTGMSLQEKIVGNQAICIFALSILLVYLVLAALYESWTNPMAVILAVPLALLGVVGAHDGAGVRQRHVLPDRHRADDRDGGQERDPGGRVRAAASGAKGVPLAEAAVNAARERFRPIMMTSIAFILGMLPLATAQGAGAAGQQVLGTAVLGGMISATLFNNLFVPPFYVMLQGFSEWLGGRKPDTAAPAAAQSRG